MCFGSRTSIALGLLAIESVFGIDTIVPLFAFLLSTFPRGAEIRTPTPSVTHAVIQSEQADQKRLRIPAPLQCRLPFTRQSIFSSYLVENEHKEHNRHKFILHLQRAALALAGPTECVERSSTHAVDQYRSIAVSWSNKCCTRATYCIWCKCIYGTES